MLFYGCLTFFHDIEVISQIALLNGGLALLDSSLDETETAKSMDMLRHRKRS